MRHDVRATPTTCKWSATSYITRFARSPAANFLVLQVVKGLLAASLTDRTMATSGEQPDQLKKISKNLIQNYRTKEV